MADQDLKAMVTRAWDAHNDPSARVVAYVTKPRACAMCGETFWQARTGRPSRFCSQACRQTAYRERHPKPPPAPPVLPVQHCEHCGAVIPDQLRRGRDTGRPARFCSASCRQAAFVIRRRRDRRARPAAHRAPLPPAGAP